MLVAACACIPEGKDVSQCTVRGFQAAEDLLGCDRPPPATREDEVFPAEVASIAIKPLQPRKPKANLVSFSPRLSEDPDTAEKQKPWVGFLTTWMGPEEALRTWEDGRSYRGEWHEDYICIDSGLGPAFANICERRPLIQDGWPHGHGELTLPGPSGGVFRGQWLNGKMHGEGEFVAKSGHRYAGQWAEGSKHGEGAETWPDGMRFQGIYVQGHHQCGALRMPSGVVRRILD
ncbi:PIP5K8 [Symbiodinium natans]|uniref:PIP5K8 protein n=1 Tax=Symbiodinium natans TaxID=878477 RepID=A0A812RMH7_9DINO|nr:PIP5K8 [Symbiodinium natans]